MRYCGVPNKFHGNPVMILAKPISIATQAAAQLNAQRVVVPQVVARRVETNDSSLNFLGRNDSPGKIFQQNHVQPPIKKAIIPLKASHAATACASIGMNRSQSSENK